MKTFALALILTTVLLGGLANPRTSTATATFCSADATFDAIAESDVIVGGRIESYAVREDLGQVSIYSAVELRMDVEHVWKGVYAGETIIDRASLVRIPVQDVVHDEWSGAGGACGALDQNPAGMYAVFGLRRSGPEDGPPHLRTNRLMTFYVGSTPYDAAALPRLTERIGLPATGDGASGRTSESALLAAIVVMAAGVALVERGRRLRAASG